ncbi:MAG: class I SAM-dependent methyltransferase [Solirubrobacterales bacterium]
MLSRLYNATWGRLFARLYDKILSDSEKAGLANKRADLLAQAQGRTLELGAGTGLNVAHYTDAVTGLTLTEPYPPMADQLRDRVTASDRDATVVEAPAEALPFEDASFDTVVFTLVLCTTPDPAVALAEAERVLRPGGRVLFLEHVRSAEEKLARWQDRLHRPWQFIGHGCHCNRETLKTIEASGLDLVEVRSDKLPKSPPIVRPLIVGAAERPGA